MTDAQPAQPEFLTVEEVTEVDKALLTAQDKFLARVSLYSLRSLKQLTETTGQSIDSITPAQISDWIANDESLQTVNRDASFDRFFTQLVFSSLKPLRQIAQEAGVAVESLTVPQVVQWFEKEAKLRLEQGQSATFLGS